MTLLSACFLSACIAPESAAISTSVTGTRIVRFADGRKIKIKFEVDGRFRAIADEPSVVFVESPVQATYFRQPGAFEYGTWKAARDSVILEDAAVKAGKKAFELKSDGGLIEIVANGSSPTKGESHGSHPQTNALDLT